MTPTPRAILLSLLIGISSSATIAGCHHNPSKVAQGQLYQSGDGRYDAYFKKVHEAQLSAGSWADDSKAARKPITTKLSLPPNASNRTIVSAAKDARDKKHDTSFTSAAAETAAAEEQLAKKLAAVAEGLDPLASEGAELEKQAVEDRHNMAADKADPAKVDKKDEVKREVSAAVDVVRSLRSDAKKGAQEAEELVTALRKELGVTAEAAPKTEAPPPPPPPKKEKDKDEAHAKKGDKPTPAKKGGSSPAPPKADHPPTPSPKPAPPNPPTPPAQKGGSDEVFNP